MASEKLTAVFAVLKGRERYGVGEDPAVEYSMRGVIDDVMTGAFTLIGDVVRSGATFDSGFDGVIYSKRQLGTGVTAFSRSELLEDSSRRIVFHHHVIGLRCDSAYEEFLRIRPWDLSDHFIENDEYQNISTSSEILQVLTDRTRAIKSNSISQSSSISNKLTSLSSSLTHQSTSLISSANSWLDRLPAAVESAASILAPVSSRAPAGVFDIEINFEGSGGDTDSHQVVDMPGAWSWALMHRPRSMSLSNLLDTVSPSVSVDRFSGIQKLETAKALSEELLETADIVSLVTFLSEATSDSDAFSVIDLEELTRWIELQISTVKTSKIRPLEDWIAKNKIGQSEEESKGSTPTPQGWHGELVKGLAVYNVNLSSIPMFAGAQVLTNCMTAIENGGTEPNTTAMISSLLSKRRARTIDSLTELLVDKSEKAWCIAAGFLFAVSEYIANDSSRLHSSQFVALLDILMPQRSIWKRLLFQPSLQIQGPAGMKNSTARRSLLISSISRVRYGATGNHPGVKRSLKTLTDSLK